MSGPGRTVPIRGMMGRHMRRFAGSVRAFIGARSGSTAVEYTVIAGLVTTAIVASLGTIAGSLGQAMIDLGALFASS